MPMKIEPKSGLAYGWDEGESGWKDGMDANILKLGLVGTHLSVRDKDLTAPPDTPNNGDSYIIAAEATGAWEGKTGQVAVWLSATASWVFYVPSFGWVCAVEDEEDALYVYRSTGWGIFEGGGGGGGAAADISYDNTESGLAAENVQDAIDELKSSIVAGSVVAILEDLTVDIGDGGDFPDLNTAIAAFDNAVLANGVTITLNVLAGEVITETVVFKGKDFSQFVIVSEEANNMIQVDIVDTMTVSVDGYDYWTDTRPTFLAINCTAPKLKAGINHIYDTEAKVFSAVAILLLRAKMTIAAVDSQSNDPLEIKNANNCFYLDTESTLSIDATLYIYCTDAAIDVASRVSIGIAVYTESKVLYAVAGISNVHINEAYSDLGVESIIPYSYCIELYDRSYCEIDTVTIVTYADAVYIEENCSLVVKYLDLVDMDLDYFSYSVLAVYEKSSVKIGYLRVFNNSVPVFGNETVSFIDLYASSMHISELSFIGVASGLEVRSPIINMQLGNAIIEYITANETVSIATPVPLFSLHTTSSLKMPQQYDGLSFELGDDISEEPVLYVDGGSIFNAPGITLQRGTVEQAHDIYIADGSHVNISGGTGGSNVTPNTISSDGILIK